MYESYNTYNPYGIYNPYYNYGQQSQQVNRQTQPVFRQQPSGIQGKVVDSLDVVKATDIPYDGSVSYFPLTDGSAIITKQLQQDGTSKVVIYKPVETSNNSESKPKYITESDLKEQMDDISGRFITEDELEKHLKDVNSKDIKDLKDDIKTLKRKLEDITDDIKYKKGK